MTDDHALFELACSYIAKGFAVFPCSKKKLPLTERGFHDATKNIDQCRAYFYTKKLGEYYIGIRTGQESGGLVVVDIDVGHDDDIRTAEEKMEYVGYTYGPLPDTLQVETQKKGRHLYYKSEKPIRCRNKIFGKTDITSVDIKGEGGYVIGPDEIDYATYDSEFDENLISPLPQWVSDLMIGASPVKPGSSAETFTGDIPLIPEMERDISRALECLDSDNRDNWIKYGMAIKSLNSDQARRLWDDWSMQSGKFSQKDQDRVWKSFRPSEINIATLFFDAKQNGYIEERIPVDEKNKQQRIEKTPFPIEFLNPPGLVGDIANLINAQSIKYQPILALGGALALCGCIMGRKIQSETGLRTNLYVMGVGDTGCGKDSARQTIKKIMTECGALEMCAVEDIASDAAIISYLEANPAGLFLLDEIGRFISVSQSTTKNAHLYNIVGQLVKLYSSAGSTYHGKVYRDKTNNMIIHQPCACIYGTTVPGTLYDSLNTENITDGLINRFLIFESDNGNPKKRRKSIDQTIPESIKNLVCEWLEKPISKSKNNIEKVLIPDPEIFYYSEEAREKIYQFDDQLWDIQEELKKKGSTPEIYARTAQQAAQVSLIIAAGRGSKAIEIIDVEYGIGLTKYISDCMLVIAQNNVSRNSFEAESKRILNIISLAGIISEREIVAKTRHMTSYQRKDIIESLIMSESIEVEFIQGLRGPAKRLFKCI